MKPISPNEIGALKAKTLPSEVIEAFNELIVKNWSGACAIIKQDEIVKLICAKLKIKPKDRQDVYDNHYLDVEDLYRAEGWRVEYDKPGYNETYEAFFKFRK